MGPEGGLSCELRALAGHVSLLLRRPRPRPGHPVFAERNDGQVEPVWHFVDVEEGRCQLWSVLHGLGEPGLAVLYHGWGALSEPLPRRHLEGDFYDLAHAADEEL